MSIKFTIEKHHQAFPTKIESGLAGRHFNMITKAPIDNGTIVGKGAYKSFENYEIATVPSTYEGVILEKAADGWGWYVEVTKVDINNPAIFIYEPEVIAETYDSRFTDESNFFINASETDPKVVHGYLLTTTDVYEISEDAFDDSSKLEAGKKVTVTGQKHIIGA